MTRKPKSKSKGTGRAKGAAKAPPGKAAPTKAGGKKPATRSPAKPAAPKFEHVFDDPRNVKRAIYVLFALCGITLLLDFVVHRHVDHPWEVLFGFYAVYGFVACVILVLAAKEMRKVLMRKEDYYDD